MSKPTHVGLAVGSPERGGFSAVVAEAKDLCNLGCRVSLLCPRGPRLAELPSVVEHTVLEAESTDLVRGSAAYRAWLKRVRPDVAHFHGRSAGVLGRGASIGLGIPVAYTAHGVFPYDRSWQRVLERVVQRTLARFTALYLMVGEAEREEWRAVHGFAGSEVALLPNVIDVAGLKDQVRLVPHGVSGEVLVPGAYHPQKRFDDVVRALEFVREPVRVRFVGSHAGVPVRRQELIDLAARLGVGDRVAFDSETSSLPAMLRRASLVLLPSGAEGLPIVGLEALSVEAACAWSNIAPHREIFGDEGIRFEVGDVHAIARILNAPPAWPSARASPASGAELMQRLASARSGGLTRLLSLTPEQRSTA